MKVLVLSAITAAAIGGAGYFFYTEHQANAAIASCHRLAGDPDDPWRDASTAGVAEGRINGPLAVEACELAYAANSTDSVIAYQLGRALLANGQIDRGMEFLHYASELGQPAAMNLYARVLAENNAAPVADLKAMFQAAANGGYGPAQVNLVTYAAPPPADFRKFSQPGLMKALYHGDIDAVMQYQAGLLAENFGFKTGMITYLSGFSEHLSSPFYCPTLLPPGLPATLQYGDTMDALARGIDLLNDPNRLEREVNRIASNWEILLMTTIQEPRNTQIAQQSGEKDAAVLAKFGCESDIALRIGAGVELLMERYL